MNETAPNNQEPQSQAWLSVQHQSQKPKLNIFFLAVQKTIQGVQKAHISGQSTYLLTRFIIKKRSAAKAYQNTAEARAIENLIAWDLNADTVGPAIITYAILGVPYYTRNYSIIYPKTLF